MKYIWGGGGLLPEPDELGRDPLRGGRAGGGSSVDDTEGLSLARLEEEDEDEDGVGRSGASVVNSSIAATGVKRNVKTS